MDIKKADFTVKQSTEVRKEGSSPVKVMKVVYLSLLFHLHDCFRLNLMTAGMSVSLAILQFQLNQNS